MRKITLSFFLGFLFILASSVPLLFAEESITITTYYPSPYGSYQDLYVANSLGIGTTTPTSRLTVDGVAPIAEIRSGGYLMLRPTANDWDMRLNAVGTRLDVLSGGAIGSPIVSFLHGGNVGIGTTNPAAKLQVNGAEERLVNDSAFRSFYNSAGTTRTGYLQIGTASSYLVNERNTPLYIRTNNADRVTILGGGNVGIGTETPSERLDVGGGNVKMGYEQISVADPSPCNNCWRAVTATCSSGKYVIGGGCGGSPASGSVVYSKPGDNSSWSCGINIGSTYSTANAYAICANIR